MQSSAVILQLIGNCWSVFRQASRSQSSVSQNKFLAQPWRLKGFSVLFFPSLPTRNKRANNHADPMHQLNDSQQTEPWEQSKGSPNATQLVSEWHSQGSLQFHEGRSFQSYCDLHLVLILNLIAKFRVVYVSDCPIQAFPIFPHQFIIQWYTQKS